MPVRLPDPDELPAVSLPQGPNQEAVPLSEAKKTPLAARQAWLPPSPVGIQQVQA